MRLDRTTQRIVSEAHSVDGYGSPLSIPRVGIGAVALEIAVAVVCERRRAARDGTVAVCRKIVQRVERGTDRRSLLQIAEWIDGERLVPYAAAIRGGYSSQVIIAVVASLIVGAVEWVNNLEGAK